MPQTICLLGHAHRLSSPPEIDRHWIESRKIKHGERWVFTLIFALLLTPGQPKHVRYIAKRLILLVCVFILFCVSTKLCLHEFIAAWVLAGKLFSRKNRLWFQDCTVYLRAWSWFPNPTSNLHQINFTSGLGLIIFCLNQSKQKHLWYTANSCLCKSYGRRIVKIMYGE